MQVRAGRRRFWRLAVKAAAVLYLVIILQALPVTSRAGTAGILATPISAVPIALARITLWSAEPTGPEGARPLGAAEFRQLFVGRRYRGKSPDLGEWSGEFQSASLHAYSGPMSFHEYFMIGQHLCFFQSGELDLVPSCRSAWASGQTYYFCDADGAPCEIIQLEEHFDSRKAR